MENQVEVTTQKANRWIIVRSYQSQFSCAEAVERLIEIHSAAKED